MWLLRLQKLKFTEFPLEQVTFQHKTQKVHTSNRRAYESIYQFTQFSQIINPKITITHPNNSPQSKTNETPTLIIRPFLPKFVTWKLLPFLIQNLAHHILTFFKLCSQKASSLDFSSSRICMFFSSLSMASPVLPALLDFFLCFFIVAAALLYVSDLVLCCWRNFFCSLWDKHYCIIQRSAGGGERKWRLISQATRDLGDHLPGRPWCLSPGSSRGGPAGPRRTPLAESKQTVTM